MQKLFIIICLVLFIAGCSSNQTRNVESHRVSGLAMVVVGGLMAGVPIAIGIREGIFIGTGVYMSGMLIIGGLLYFTGVMLCKTLEDGCNEKKTVK